MSAVHSRLRLWLAVMFFAVVGLALPRSVLAQSTDAKLRAGFTGKIKLSDRVRLDLEQQQRLSADVGFEKAITDFELRVQATDFLRIGAAYRAIATDDDGFWHRGSLNAGLGHDLGSLGLSYLLRWQSTRRSTETVSVLRNKFGLEYDIGGKLTPSASFELHYSTTNAEFREARITLGVDRSLSKRTSIGLAYMLQSEFNKQVDETNHVLRLGLSYRFRKPKKLKRTEVSGD